MCVKELKKSTNVIVSNLSTDNLLFLTFYTGLFSLFREKKLGEHDFSNDNSLCSLIHPEFSSDNSLLSKSHCNLIINYWA